MIEKLRPTKKFKRKMQKIVYVFKNNACLEDYLWTIWNERTHTKKYYSQALFYSLNYLQLQWFISSLQNPELFTSKSWTLYCKPFVTIKEKIILLYFEQIKTLRIRIYWRWKSISNKWMAESNYDMCFQNRI